MEFIDKRPFEIVFINTLAYKCEKIITLYDINEPRLQEMITDIMTHTNKSYRKHMNIFELYNNLHKNMSYYDIQYKLYTVGIREAKKMIRTLNKGNNMTMCSEEENRILSMKRDQYEQMNHAYKKLYETLSSIKKILHEIFVKKHESDDDFDLCTDTEKSSDEL